MHIISKRPFLEAIKKYPNQERAILELYSVLKKNHFFNPGEMKKLFPSLDNFKYKKKWWVLDIGGNNLRMICFIEFLQNRMYIKYIVNHTDYDRLCQRYRKGELS